MATEAQINAIVGLYVAYFDRAPDPAGLQFWIDQLDNGRDFTTISQDFADSAEAQAIYPYLSDDNDLGTISPVAFITNIYANLFGRVPDQAGLEFWTEVLESGAVAPGDMVEAISLGAKDNLNDNGFFDRSVLDNKIECARYFTDQAGEIGTFPQGDQPGQFEIGSPEYLAAVGAVGAAGNQMDNFEECQDFIDTLLREFIPNSSFTLCPVKVFVSSETEIETMVTEKVLYWGFANTDGTGTPNPGENGGTDSTSVISNGIPADAFFGPGGYFQTLALQEFAELDVIDTDMDQFSIIDWSSVTDISITVNNSTGGEDGDNDIVDGNNEGGVLTVTYPDGSTDDIALGARYFDFLCKLVLDDDGNSRFYEQEVVVGLPVYIDASGEFTTTPQPGQEPVGTIERGLIEVQESGEYVIQTDTPIVLTPTVNNGGTFENGFTSDDNDFIQVGQVELLHGAIIDGGGGYNTLEIDAKGHFAQPKALNNIQQITVENLPNIYTIGEDNSSQYPDVVNILEVVRDAVATAIGDGADPDDINLLEILADIDLTDVGGLEGLGALLQAFLGLPDTDSVIDLSRATDLDNLTVTEGSYLWLDSAITAFPFVTDLLSALNGNAGALNLVGMRNDATLTLQGDFSLPLYVQTSAGFSGDGFTVIMENVNSDISNGAMYIFQNAPKLNLVSEGGGNYIRNLNENEGAGINGHVTDLEISGSAHLFIESNLNNIFENDTPATIDASENTGGVDLNISGLEHVTFVGSQGNDRFSALTRNDGDTSQGPDFIPDSEITISNAVGDNYYDVEAKKLTLTDGDGNIELEADTSGATVVLGNGDNIIAIDTAELSLTVGDGDNIIDVEMEDPTFDDDDQAQVLENKNQFEKRVDIVAGDGANKICVEIEGDDDSNIGSDTFDYLLDDAVVNITAGNGGNIIEVIQDTNDFTLSDVNINTGDGNDTIRVEADDISINSGGGNDTIVLVGTDDDFTFDEVDTESGGSGDQTIDSGFTGRSVTENEFSAGVLLNIDTGTGSANIHLGADGEDDGLSTKNIIAKDGSVITGEDITLHVNTYANLIGASLSGIGSVILDDDAGDRSDSAQANDPYAGDRAQLTLTVDQFMAIGAENFTVDGGLFDTHSFIKLIVDEDTSLDALGVENLSRNIDLYIEIRDGAEVTMTAEQLHTKVARDGVTLAEDGNTDYGAGSVVITGGGFNFDPFNTNDKVQSVIGGTTYFGGSLSSDFGSASGGWFNVQVQSVYQGYDRPADVSAEIVLTIDTDTTPAVEGFSTWHTNLEIVGDGDVTFDGAIELGEFQGNANNLFTIDFSELVGTATGLTIGNFETVREVRGNSNLTGLDNEVFIEIAGNDDDDGANGGSGDQTIGFDDDGLDDDTKVDDRVLITSGVTKYTVTVIEGPVMSPTGDTATIRLNDVTQDVETFALRGNWNDTLEILDAAWGLNFELQAGGTAKAEGPTKYANVGSLDASFKWYCAETTVDIFHSVFGDTRTIKTGSIVLNNVETANINATGDTIIESISGTSSEGYLDTINLTGTGDLEIVEKIDASETDGVNTIDASGVAGVVTLGIDGGFEEDIEEGMGNDFTFIGSDAGSVVTLCDVDDDWAGVTLTGGAAGMDLIIADGDGIVDLDESTLTNINSITLEPGSTLRIQLSDADAVGAENILFGGKPDMDDPANLQLAGLGEEPFAIANYNPGINVSLLSLANQPEITLNPATDLTGIGGLEVPEGTILNLTAEQFQQLDGDGAITGVDGTTNFTVNITDWTQASVDFDDGDDTDADNFTLMGITADNVTITMAEDVELGADDGLATDSGLAEVITIDGVTLTLADVQQADGLQIGGGTGTTLKFTDTDSGVFESIDASGFNVDTLLVLNVLVADRNVDRLFFGLPETVTKQIYTGIGFVDGVTQNVIIEEGTTVPGFLAFVRPEADTELRILNLTMEGGTEIDGDLLVSASTNEDGRVQANLQEVNIVSTGTAGNLINGETANVITGDLTPIGLFTFIPGASLPDGDGYLSVSNDLLNVNISGDQDFILEGQIIFESVTLANNPVSDDGITANDDEEAVATLTVNNSASTTIGDLDTDDEDVDFLVVNNEGTGDLTIGISSTATVDPEDVITLNGSATGTDTVIVSGGRDFSGDTINADWDVILMNNGTNENTAVTVTVTQAQFGAIGTAGFQTTSGQDDAGDNTATLNIVQFDGSVPFDATGLDPDIDIGTITMAPGAQTLDPSTNLTGVGKIEVPEGGTLTLSAAQYQQIAGSGGLKICPVDGTDSNSTIDAPITVNITGLTQADIDNGPFDLSMILTDDENDDGVVGNVTVSLAENVELSDDDTVQTADGADAGTDTESNVEFLLADGQDLGIALFSQADGLEITGTGTTDVFFRFDTLDDGVTEPSPVTGSLDVSGYSISQLHALNTFVGGYNIELLLSELASDIELVVYHDPEDLGFLNPTNRVVIIEAGVTVADGSPGGPSAAFGFADPDSDDEVLSITIVGEGGTRIEGDILFPALAPGLVTSPQMFLQSFTFISQGDGVTENLLSGGTPNVIVGDLSPNNLPGPGGATYVENNLLVVNLEATQELDIQGTIEFNGLATGDDTASLNVSGTAPVMIEQLQVEGTGYDADNITDFSINNTGTGTLTVTGASNSIQLSPAVETLTFTGTGDIVLDTTASTAFGDSGVNGAGLSTMDASGLTGDLSLGVVENVDNDDFSFTSGTGVTTMTMAYDDLADGALPSDTGWSFDFSSAAAGSQLTLGLDTADGAASNLTFAAMSDLAIDMGPDGVLCINQDMDLSAVNLTLSSTQPIVVKDGANVVLTAAQASGLTFVGENGALSTGEINIVGLGDDPVDLSGISADIAGRVFLEDDDVTLDAATDLGDMTIALIAKDDSDLNPTEGQTIRMATEAQADGAAIDVIKSFVLDGLGGVTVTDWVAADDTSGNTFFNSTNVALLFNSIADPLDTSNYDDFLGRLWYSNDLLNSVGGAVEDLFNTLPFTIQRVDFNTVVELDILLASAAVDRVVELTSFTDIVGLTEVDDGPDPEEHIATLTVEFGGEVTAGDFVIGDVVAAPDTDPLTPDFTKLTLNSRAALDDEHFLATEDYVNDNDTTDETGETVKPMTINTIGDIMVGGTNPLIELMDVEINTFGDASTSTFAGDGDEDDGDQTVGTDDGADFSFQTLTFSSAGDDVDALLTVTGDGTVTGKAYDVSDSDITSVTIDTTGFTGTLVWTGGSPAAIGGDDTGDGNTETMTFTGSGTVLHGKVLGDDPDTPEVETYYQNDDGTDPYAGVDASTVSTIDTTAQTGLVDLGIVTDIDSEDFTLNNDGSTGDVIMCLGTALNADGVLETPELSATGSWNFSNEAGATGSMTLELKAVTLNAGGSIELDDVDLVISGDIDLTVLDVADLSFSGGSITVCEDATLTLSVEQAAALAAAGYTITGGGTLKVVGAADDVDFDDLFGTGTVDLSDVSLDDPVTDADGAVAYELQGAVNKDGEDITQNLIGTAFNDEVTLTSAVDGSAATLTDGVAFNLAMGDDTGSIGDAANTLTDGSPEEDALEEVGDVIVNNGALDPDDLINIVVDAGFDQVDGLATGDRVQVSSGAEFFSEDVFSPFIASAETTNNGGVGVIQDTSGDAEVDMSSAGGTDGWFILGASADGSSNELTGSANDDYIDGGDTDQDSADDSDLLTGGAGADNFNFGLELSSPTAPTVTMTTAGQDNEILNYTPDDADDDDEALDITIRINGVAQVINVDLSGVDPTVEADVEAAVASALNALANISASVVGGEILIEGDGTSSVEFISSAATGTVDSNPADASGELDAAASEPGGGDADIAQLDTVSIPATVVDGETYSITVTTSTGTTIGAEAIASGTSGAAVAATLRTNLAAADAGGDLTIGGAGTDVTIEAADADAGGFTTVANANPAVTGTGSSDFGATDLALADIITDFVSGEDTIDLNAVAGAGIDGTNYEERDAGDPEAVSFAAAFTEADAVIDGTITYYFTTSSGMTTYAADSAGGLFLGGVGGDIDDQGLLFYDADSNGSIDGVIHLVGVDLDDFAAGDIV